MLMKKSENVIDPFPNREAVLSQSPTKDGHQFPATEPDPFDQTDDHPHVR
jgi:hypothetical protein